MAVTILVGCTPKDDCIFTADELFDQNDPKNLDLSDGSVDFRRTEDYLMICLVKRLAKSYPNQKFILMNRCLDDLGMAEDYCGWIIAMDFDFNFEQSEISKVMNCRFKDPDGGNLTWEDICNRVK